MESVEQVGHEGERIIGNEVGTSLLREHEDRYRFALKFLSGRETVLDCACGSGYGTKILSSSAKAVHGVDLCEVAIEHAKRHHGASNVAYSTASVYGLPFASESVDLYCSFETIEHVERPRDLTAEAWRVLKPGGLFLVSTPNRILTRVGPGEKPAHNPFHLFELSLGELDELLRGKFSGITHFGQRIKSRTKLELPYMASKMRRLLGREDIISMNVAPSSFSRFDSLAHWQPVTLVAACRK